jgi:flagellar biosynthetic protein FliR
MNELANKINLMNLPTEGLVKLVDQIPEYGLLILAPMGVLSFVMVIGLFFLSKAAPTMNLFSVGMPLRVGLGLLCLVMFLPVLIKSMVMYFHQMLAELEQLLGFFE